MRSSIIKIACFGYLCQRPLLKMFLEFCRFEIALPVEFVYKTAVLRQERRSKATLS